MNALEKNLGQAEKKTKDAAESLQCQQKEAEDREQQLAAIVASRERAIAGKLMAAAKEISGKPPCSSFECYMLQVLFLVPHPKGFSAFPNRCFWCCVGGISPR